MEDIGETASREGNDIVGEGAVRGAVKAPMVIEGPHPVPWKSQRPWK